MKKILAMVLAMMLVLSMSAAFAEDPAAITGITKTYTGNATFEPNEVLDLTVTCTAVDSLTEGSSMTAATAPKPTVAYNMDNNTFTLTAPTFTETGRYTYTLVEIDDGTAGVTEYDADAVTVQYLAVWNSDNTQIIADGPYLSGTGDKKDSFTNNFDVYTLDITKKLTGNMADYSDTFEITVIFTSDHEVKSDIAYTVKGVADANGIKGENEKTEAVESNWTKSGNVWTKTVKITLGGNNSSAETAAQFTNIPSGVVVTVEETDADPAYDASYTLDEEEYTAKANITMDDDHAVVITNDYDTEVNTGISLDNAPYMILMALVVIAGAALIVKRASANR